LFGRLFTRRIVASVVVVDAGSFGESHGERTVRGLAPIFGDCPLQFLSQMALAEKRHGASRGSEETHSSMAELDIEDI
jgi:hypothetical protein